MNKIKILFFISSLGIGGSENQLHFLAKNLNKQKYKLMVCTIKYKGDHFVSKLRQNNIEVVQLGINKITDIFNLNKLKELRKKFNYLNKKRFDIIHGFLFYGKLIGFLFKIFSNTPILISGERNTGYWRTIKHIFIEKFIDRYIDLYIAISHAVKNSLKQQLKIRGDKIKVVYNGIDENIFYKKNSNEKGENDDIVIATVGRLHPVKGHRYFLDLAFNLIKDYSKNIQFWIIGDGKEKDNLIDYGKKLGIEDNIDFLGNIDGMEDIYNKIDILVICSHSEGFSNVTAEAMLCGTPIAAFGVGSLFEVIDDGITGFVVEFGNIEQMEKKIIKLVNDKNLYKNMSHNSIQKAKNMFTLTRLVSDTEKIYDFIYYNSIEK